MNQSFFSISELNTSKPKLRHSNYCGACGLYKHCQSPKMTYKGQGRKKILVVGEAPGCISGDTLIDTTYRDKSKYPNGVPIKNLVGKKNVFVYSFDVKKQCLVISKAKRIWKTGRKKVFEVSYEWSFAKDKKSIVRKNKIKVTSNHKFLLKKPIKHDPFLGMEDDRNYVSIDNGLLVGHSLQPFHRTFDGRYYHIGAFANKMTKESRLLLSHKIGRDLKEKEQNHHRNENKVDDSYDNLKLMTLKKHSQYHTLKQNPMSNPDVKRKHNKIMQSKSYRENQSKIMKRVLSNPKVYAERLKQIAKCNYKRQQTVKKRYEEPVFYYKYLLGRIKVYPSLSKEWLEDKFKCRFPRESFPPIDNHKVVNIRYIGVEDVYDIEVEIYHNFAANGIFIHNSEEDRDNEQFVGKAGKRLKYELKKCGINLNADCWKTNAIRCHPEDNKTPDSKQITHCRPALFAEINKLKPNIILLFGSVATEAVLGHLWNDGGTFSMNKWTDWIIPHQELNCWISAHYQPSYLERQKSDLLDVLFRKHLNKAVKKKDRPWKTIPNYQDEVEVIYKPSQVVKVLQGFDDIIAFDYETNCLKPEYEGAEIVSCSVSDGKRTYAYPWAGDAIMATDKLLKSSVRKIASNMKFEERWTRYFLKHRVHNWDWDTMLAAHILNNATGITGLKFQAFVQLGQSQYDKHIEPYLKSSKGQHLNRIREIPLKDLLVYNGTDALLEHKLAALQKRRF